MQFNIPAAAASFTALLSGQLQGQQQAAQDAAEQEQRQNQQRIALFQTLEGQRQRASDDELGAIGQLAPGDRDRALAAHYRTAGQPSPNLSILPADLRKLIPAPGGSPFPASESSAGAGPTGQPLPPTAQLQNQAGVLAPQGPHPEHFGLANALQSLTGQQSSPLAAVPAAGPPPGSGPSGQPGPQTGSLPDPTGSIVTQVAFHRQRFANAGGEPGAAPPPAVPAPTLQSPAQPTGFPAPAPVSVGQAGAPTTPQTHVPPQPPDTRPTYQIGGETFHFQTGPGERETAELMRQVDQQTRYVSQNLAVASPEQRAAFDQYFRTRPTRESLAQPGGVAAAQNWLNGLTSLSAFVGKGARGQADDDLKQYNAIIDPLLKGQVTNPLEAATLLVQAKDLRDQIGQERAGGEKGGPISGAKNIFGAYDPQIEQIRAALNRGDQDTATTLARDVSGNIALGWSPQQEGAASAGLLRLLGGMSTEARQDPANLRAVIAGTPFAARFKDIPDAQLVQILGGGALAEKARNTIEGNLAKLSKLPPSARTAVLDSLNEYRRAAGDQPLEIDPKEFDRLTPLEQARLAAYKVTAATRLNADARAAAARGDAHALAEARLGLIGAQKARYDALAQNPAAGGRTLTPNAQLLVERNSAQRAAKVLDNYRAGNKTAAGIADRYLMSHPDLDRYVTDPHSPNAPAIDTNDPAIKKSVTAQRVLLLAIAEAQARQHYGSRALELSAGKDPAENFANPTTTAPAGALQRTTTTGTVPAGGGQADFDRTVDALASRGVNRADAIGYLRQHPNEVIRGAR